MSAAKSAGRDLAHAALVIQEWLCLKIDGASDVRITNLARTGGMSHEILCFDADWNRGGKNGRQSFVIRVDPAEHRKRIGMNLRREFDALTAIEKQGDVPVPKPYWYEEDATILGAQFYCMELVQGRTPLDNPPYQTHGWLVDMAPAQRRLLWRSGIETLAKIHRFPSEQLRLLRRDTSDDDDFAQHVKLQHETYLWAMDGHANEASDSAWKWLLENPPQNRPAGLIWGDARIGNMMFDGTNCVAVVDWEDVALASPVADLGRWCFVEAIHARWGLPRLEGFGDRSETIELWEECSGLSAADLRWYEIFAISCGISGLARIHALQLQDIGGQQVPAKMNISVFNGLIEEWMTEGVRI